MVACIDSGYEKLKEYLDSENAPMISVGPFYVSCVPVGNGLSVAYYPELNILDDAANSMITIENILTMRGMSGKLTKHRGIELLNYLGERPYSRSVDIVADFLRNRRGIKKRSERLPYTI